MAGLEMSASQRMALQQKLSPLMLQKIDILALQADDLRERIYEEAEKNPALEIKRDSSYVSASTGDSHQAFLESRPDFGASLQEALLEQLSELPLSPEERDLGERIIQNLDKHGYYIEPCKNLLKTGESVDMLNSLVSRIQQFDPAGVCCSGLQESLLLQARRKTDVPYLVFELLEKHFELLEVPRPPLVARKLNELSSAGVKPVSADDVEEALAFIRELDPYPAHQFSDRTEAVYASPDVIVRRATSEEEEENGFPYVVELLKGFLPEATVSSDFKEMEKEEGEAGRFARDSVQNAKNFLTAVEQRTSTVLKTAQFIVRRQRAFFDEGPGHLVPLKMLDAAEELGVHEATISRVVNGKYLRCSWGMFELRTFFTSSVQARTPSAQKPQKAAGASVQQIAAEDLSRERVKLEITKILQENEEAAAKAAASGGKPVKRLSDEKLAALLAERGMNISRRTVAKYRSELNIKSSFDR